MKLKKEVTLEVKELTKNVIIDVKIKGLKAWGYKVRVAYVLLWLVKSLNIATITIGGDDDDEPPKQRSKKPNNYFNKKIKSHLIV